MILTQHLYLTGYRATGKSSVARRLADQWSVPMIDLDVAIEAEADQTIRQIFDQGGEPLFRKLESRSLDQAAASPTPTIISLGGGAVLDQANRDLLARTGRCVWLDASVETVCRRMQIDQTTADRRPSLTARSQADEVRMLMARRRPLYQGCADLWVDTEGKTIDQVAAEITAFFESNEIPDA